ncbi:MAG: alpha/beta fold hydrolase [Longimicrobiales bacterium]
MAEPILSHERVATASPARWLYVLHGIYGAGRNWATVARRIARERADWGVVLVDLREHGASQGFSPPHTLVAAAEDLVELARGTGEAPAAMLGHSFGGKVALAYARRAPERLEQLWIVDSTPDAREPGGSAWEMLHVLRKLPEVFATRDEAIEALVAGGVARPVAQWMATNLEKKEVGYSWRLDFDAMEALLRDFFRSDLWPVVEREDGPEIHFVKAAESSVVTEEAAARIEASGDRVLLHHVASSHWVNADNPDALVELVVRELPTENGGE